MKKLSIMIVIVTLLLAGNCFAQPLTTFGHDDDDTVVRLLATSGEICKVYGHWWERGYEPVKCNGMRCTESREYRKCKLCGKKEYFIQEWRGAK